ncbi:MAG TPA: class II aldolase/adducin family protein [Solirubrobacteraceae bacterium]|nr:class II aldolase/adducin family protein [Solirubrobacteraceae bacterium]
MQLVRERERIVAAARRLAEDGQVAGTAGNLSERAGDLVAVTPTGGALDSLTPEQVAVVDLDGEQVDGDLRPTSELGLHLGVYRRYGVGAVVHTHPPYATALACVVDQLPVVHYQMLALGGSVRVARYETFGTEELAAVTLDALEGRAAALMASHGAIVHGPDLDVAMAQSSLLEWACALYWRAAAIGQPRTLNERQLMDVVNAIVGRGYGTPQARTR